MITSSSSSKFLYDFESLHSEQVAWHPGIADLLGLLAPMMYSPGHGLMGVPAPDNGLLFHGITSSGSGKFPISTWYEQC